MNYKLIIFDMDGTILDTLQDLTNSINYTLKCASLPLRTIDEIKSFVGDGIKTLIKRAAPENTPQEVLDDLYNIFMPYYNLHNSDFTSPYDGIIELLNKIREAGFKTAVVSNKANHAVQELCNSYFPNLFDYALGESPELPKKPSPAMVNHILDISGIPKEEAVYIGDSDVDVATAINSELDLIAVDWGFRSREVLIEKGAKTIVSTPLEILALL